LEGRKEGMDTEKAKEEDYRTSELVRTGKLIIEFSKEEDVDQILELANRERLLLKLSPPVVKVWIENKCSLVAREVATGRVVAHQAVKVLNSVAILRSAVVDPEFRRQKINTVMKLTLIEELRKRNPDIIFVAVTLMESHTIEILKRLGFVPIAVDDIPEVYEYDLNHKSDDQAVCQYWALRPNNTNNETGKQQTALT